MKYKVEEDSHIAEQPTVGSCMACGACCIEPIVQIRTTGRRGHKGPCSALVGKIGESVSCSIYEERPKMCKTFDRGSPECLIARSEAGLSNV